MADYVANMAFISARDRDDRPDLFNTVPRTGREFLTRASARCSSSPVVFPSSTTRRRASVYGENAKTSAVWSNGGRSNMTTREGYRCFNSSTRATILGEVKISVEFEIARPPGSKTNRPIPG